MVNGSGRRQGVTTCGGVTSPLTYTTITIKLEVPSHHLMRSVVVVVVVVVVVTLFFF